MTKIHKYLVQSIALLIFGRYVMLNRETVNPYSAKKNMYEDGERVQSGK